MGKKNCELNYSRVISLPSPLCLTYNFFIFMDFSDPGKERVMVRLLYQVISLFITTSKSFDLRLPTNQPPGNMLAWLAGELAAAEVAGEKVTRLA